MQYHTEDNNDWVRHIRDGDVGFYGVSLIEDDCGDDIDNVIIWPTSDSEKATPAPGIINE